MNTPLDQAISAAAAAEATIAADQTNLANIQTAIATASQPLPTPKRSQRRTKLRPISLRAWQAYQALSKAALDAATALQQSSGGTSGNVADGV